ncbi:hypothetical protein NQ318_007725, partial [Aromia moschata]
MGRLNRWRLLQRLHQDFWSRWHSEYLHTLLQKGKCTTSSNLIIPGTKEAIKNSQAPLLRWQLARVVGCIQVRMVSCALRRWA